MGSSYNIAQRATSSRLEYLLEGIEDLGTSLVRALAGSLCLVSVSSNVIGGGCLCGSVRYEATGPPYNITHCHCSDCRGGAGAPFVTWASFRREDFRFTTGRPRVLPWAGRLRSFCPQCGTSLTFMTAADAAEVDVTVCSFDHPETVTPADHTWVEDRLPWIRVTDDLPTYRQTRANHA